jgi:hypothetical protein
VDWTEFIWMRRDTNGGLLSVGNVPSCSARRGKNLYLTEQLSAWQEALCCTGQSSWFLLAFTSLCRHGPILLSRQMIEDTPTLKTGIYWLPSLNCVWMYSSPVQYSLNDTNICKTEMYWPVPYLWFTMTSLNFLANSLVLMYYIIQPTNNQK